MKLSCGPPKLLDEYSFFSIKNLSHLKRELEKCPKITNWAEVEITLILHTSKIHETIVSG